jgi:hypothetical protein
MSTRGSCWEQNWWCSFWKTIANYHEGKPYGAKVPFERLYPRRPDQGIEN